MGRTTTTTTNNKENFAHIKHSWIILLEKKDFLKNQIKYMNNIRV